MATRLRHVLALDALVDLLAVDGDILGCADAYAHLVALDAEHRDGDLVPDHQGFAYSAGQNQHVTSPCPRPSMRRALPLREPCRPRGTGHSLATRCACDTRPHGNEGFRGLQCGRDGAGVTRIAGRT